MCQRSDLLSAERERESEGLTEKQMSEGDGGGENAESLLWEENCGNERG